jgi:K+-sensing histidine kinase KdpD
MVVAGIGGFVFHSTRFKDIVPCLFIPVIGLVAARFGTWSGIVGTIGSVLIFAEFLFAPVYSLRVTNSAQRNNLVWMVIGGFTLSEVLGVQTLTDGKPTDRKRRP